jgi:hypothetical protein
MNVDSEETVIWTITDDDIVLEIKCRSKTSQNDYEDDDDMKQWTCVTIQLSVFQNYKSA